MKGVLALFILLAAAADLRGASEVLSVLVLPFENQSARPDLNWISESFAEILSSRLSAPERYVLGRRERNGAYEHLAIPPGTPLTLASSYKVAETLGVDWVVMGSFGVEGQWLTARAQLLDMRRLKLSRELEATGELADLVDLQTRLVWRLLATNDPGFTVGVEEEFRGRFPSVRLDAFENYIRGLLAVDSDARIRFLKEADRLNPADHRAAMELGRYYFDQKDYANSARWLRKVDPKDLDYREALFLLGVDEFFLGYGPSSEKTFRELSELIPLNEVWNNLGLLQARRGSFTEALASFERAYQADPTDADFCFNLAACLWYVKRYREAAQRLEEALRIAPEDSETHTLLAVVLGRLGDSAGTQREIRWLAANEGNSSTQLPGDLSPHFRLKKNYDGRAFRLLSLAVRNALEERLAGEPPAQHAEVHVSRGREYLGERRLREAEQELAEAVSLFPGHAEAHLLLGQTYKAQKRHREAAAELEASLKLGSSAVAHLWLAQVYLLLNQREAARDHGRAALTLDPDHREAQQLMRQIGEDQPAEGNKP